MAFFSQKALIIIGPFESLPARTWWFTGKIEQIERTGIDLTLRHHMIPCKDRLDSRWDVSETAGGQRKWSSKLNGEWSWPEFWDNGTDCWWFYHVLSYTVTMCCDQLLFQVLYILYITSQLSCVGKMACIKVQSAARRVNTAVKESESHNPKIQLFESALHIKRTHCEAQWMSI